MCDKPLEWIPVLINCFDLKFQSFNLKKLSRNKNLENYAKTIQLQERRYFEFFTIKSFNQTKQNDSEFFSAFHEFNFE